MKAGTKKNKRLYEIEYPNYLCSGLPKPPYSNTECYIYKILITPLFETDPENEHLINLFSTSNCYGILTTKKLPKLAEMPLFMNYGKLQAKISSEPIIVKIQNENDLNYLRNFHIMIFRDLLQIWKQFLSYDLQNLNNSYLIVPLLNGQEIHWNLIKRFQNLSKIREPTEMQRAKQRFNPNDYLGNIVCPWYSIDTDLRYVIIKIRNDLKPSSPFPNSDYNTFADYIYDKYQKIVIQKDNQFLLEAKAITTTMNFLHYHNDNGNIKRKRKLDDILLIPELCHNFYYPGDLYLKAKFLPSILHRLHYLLLAEELRLQINSYLNLKFSYNDNNNYYQPQTIIIDTTLKRIIEEKNRSIKSIRSIKLPNPITTKTQKLNEIHTITENIQYRWKSYEEPCDFSRYLDQLYRIELDYYHHFVTDALNQMAITNNNEILPEINSIAASTSTKLAICDKNTPSEKFYIHILDIIEPQKTAEQWEFLSALTASSAADVFDMERIELLGDSFLKFSISLYLLRKHPLWNEGHLTSVKSKFVSNRNLLYCGIKMKLPGKLYIHQFSPFNDWLPPLCCVPINILNIINRDNISPNILWELKLDDNECEMSKCKDETILNFISHSAENSMKDIECNLNAYVDKQCVSDKTVADSMEALLGVCVKNYGIRKSFTMLEFLGIVPKDNENLSNLLNLNLGSPRLKTNIPDREIDAFLINYQELEQKLGYVLINFLFFFLTLSVSFFLFLFLVTNLMIVHIYYKH